LEILTAIYSGASIIYMLFGFFILLFLRQHKHGAGEEQPHISVIVACRNEAAHLAQCLDSLAQLDYSKELLEIILVDDQSQDHSSDIIQDYCQRNAHFTSLLITQKTKPGKAGAVLEGIAASHGEIICITDADCVVPRTWIQGLLEGFGEKVGMVGGYTLLDNKHEHAKLFHKIQSCDHLYLLGVAGALSALNVPASWLGNNLAFRRSVYDEVGGYQHLNDSLVEDFALIKAIDSQTDWQINFTANLKSTIVSKPVNRIVEFYNQRKRWASGISQTRIAGITVMAAAFLTHILQIFSFFVLPFSQWFIFFSIVICVDFLLLWRSAALVNRKDLLRYFWAFELYYYLYSVLLPVFSLFDRKINWKGRDYEPRHFRVSE